MKIVRVIARLNVGGPAKHVVWLTAGLQGHCETVLVAGTVPAGEEDMGYFATEHGVAPRFLAEMSREISPKDIVSVWKLYRLFVQERPDIVHTHTAKAGTVGRVAGFLYRWLTPAVLLGRPRQCKFIHTYHGHIFHGYYGPVKTKTFLAIEKMLARITDRIVVVSDQQRQEINETFGVGRRDRFKVVPLGLDLSVFSDAASRREVFRGELNAGPNELLIGIVGRLTEIKNVEMFLDAVSLFLKKPEVQSLPVRFVVIGDGALRKRLEEKSRSMAIDSKVIFAGNRTDPENFYPALDVVALTSQNEGTPLTLIEAMANARPVISTAVGGVVDLLGEPTERGHSYTICRRGISVRRNDAQAFADGLARIATDQRLRDELATHGQAYATQRHSKERLLEDIRGLYDELLHPGSRERIVLDSARALEGKRITH